MRLGCEVVTCNCLSSGEAGIEAAGVVTGWLVGPEGLIVTCGYLSSIEDGVESAEVSVRRWDRELLLAAVCPLGRLV